jgi:hypothetical protein
MPTFYATFGFGQPLASHYVKLEAADLSDANKKMHDAYGTCWSMTYLETEYGSCIAPFPITEIPFTPSSLCARCDTAVYFDGSAWRADTRKDQQLCEDGDAHDPYVDMDDEEIELDRLKARVAELEAEVVRLKAQVEVAREGGYSDGQAAGYDAGFADGCAQ